jgi:hypothetical protein
MPIISATTRPARLVHRDRHCGFAGSYAQHHRRAAALAASRWQRVHLVDREGDDGARRDSLLGSETE